MLRRTARAWVALALALPLPLPLPLGTARAEAQIYHFRPERARRALDVTVAGGDRIRLAAGGCFRRPDGTTEPLLQTNRAAAQALIFIPGVTLSFLPVADLLGRDLGVPGSLETPVPAKIWIDWGSFPRSRYETGSAAARSLPCTTPNRAPFLDVTIRHGASSARDRGAPGSLTLQLSRYDRNMLPLNPDWVGGTRPDPCKACDGFRLGELPDGTRGVALLRNPLCTVQRPEVDADCAPNSGFCPGRAALDTSRYLGGHVNWGPATFTGRVSTHGGGSVHIARDGDAELVIEPDGAAGVITAPPGAKYAGRIGMEFDSARTIRWFRTPFWREFPFRNANFDVVASFFGTLRRHRSAAGPVPALLHRPAVAIGLFGIDNVHDVHSELHPLYAIAIQLEASASAQRWAVFARRGGMEGECGSRLEHTIDLKRVALPLGAAAGAPWDGVRGEFFDHGLPVADWKVYAGPSSPTLVVGLPERPCSVVEGEITLERGRGQGGALAPGEPPVSEPVLWTSVTKPGEWCEKEDWFVEVD